MAKNVKAASIVAKSTVKALVAAAQFKTSAKKFVTMHRPAVIRLRWFPRCTYYVQMRINAASYRNKSTQPTTGTSAALSCWTMDSSSDNNVLSSCLCLLCQMRRTRWLWQYQCLAMWMRHYFRVKVWARRYSLEQSWLPVSLSCMPTIQTFSSCL